MSDSPMTSDAQDATRDAAPDEAATAALVDDFRRVTAKLRSEVGRIVVGQDDVVEHLLITLFVGGHCLVTGMPGTAKTLLVRTLADALGLRFDRIQFTPDLMPTDITGTDIIDEDEHGHRAWRFVPGPIFTNVLLADEINRAPPKTQSALLEAMQEGSRHRVGGTRVRDAEQPFFVLATQNPLELEGTYPLPEAQLDRFLFDIILDYLPLEDELTVVERFTGSVAPAPVETCTNAEQVLAFQRLVRQVPVSKPVGRYAVELVRATRPGDAAASDTVRRYVKFGASVRAALAIVLASKARALMQGRVHVTIDDIDALAAPVLRHRMQLNYFAEADGMDIDAVLADLVARRMAA